MLKDSLLKCWYEPIKILEHYLHIILLWSMSLFTVIGGMYLGAPIEWMLIVTGGFIYLNIAWWNCLKKENNTPVFKVNDDGIDMAYEGQPEEFVSWSDVTEVEVIGTQDTKDRRPGFFICYGDKKVMVYQRIENFVKFYECFKERNIKGAERPITVYDRRTLNIYGAWKEGMLG